MKFLFSYYLVYTPNNDQKPPITDILAIKQARGAETFIKKHARISNTGLPALPALPYISDAFTALRMIRKGPVCIKSVRRVK